MNYNSVVNDLIKLTIKFLWGNYNERCSEIFMWFTNDCNHCYCNRHYCNGGYINQVYFIMILLSG